MICFQLNKILENNHTNGGRIIHNKSVIKSLKINNFAADFV